MFFFSENHYLIFKLSLDILKKEAGLKTFNLSMDFYSPK